MTLGSLEWLQPVRHMSLKKILNWTLNARVLSIFSSGTPFARAEKQLAVRTMGQIVMSS
jgi:hypothetical protein